MDASDTAAVGDDVRVESAPRRAVTRASPGRPRETPHEAVVAAYRDLHQRTFHSTHEELSFLRTDYIASRKARLLQREEIARLTRQLRRTTAQLAELQEAPAPSDDAEVRQSVSGTTKDKRHGRDTAASALSLYAAAAQATAGTRTESSAARSQPGRTNVASHFNTVELIDELRRNLAQRDTALAQLRLDHDALVHARDVLEGRLRRTQQELLDMTHTRDDLHARLTAQSETIMELETRCHTAEQDARSAQEELARLRVRHTTLELLQSPQSTTATRSDTSAIVPSHTPPGRDEERRQVAEMAALQERLREVQKALQETTVHRDALHAQLQQVHHNETMTHVLQSQNDSLKQRLSEVGGELHQLQQREGALQVQVQHEITERVRGEHAQLRLQRAMERTVQHAELLQAAVTMLRGKLGLEQGRRLVLETRDLHGRETTTTTTPPPPPATNPSVDALRSENKGYAALLVVNETLQEELRQREAELQRVAPDEVQRLREERSVLLEDNAVLATGAEALRRHCAKLQRGFVAAHHTRRAARRRRVVRRLRATLRAMRQSMRDYELLLTYLDAQGAVTAWVQQLAHPSPPPPPPPIPTPGGAREGVLR